MDADIFIPEGKPTPLDESGELVCKKPALNMPAMVRNHPDRKRYHVAYLGSFPHVWCRGDFIRFDPETKNSVLMGRCDGVLVLRGSNSEVARSILSWGVALKGKQ